jgi:hypothetical protein
MAKVVLYDDVQDPFSPRGETSTYTSPCMFVQCTNNLNDVMTLYDIGQHLVGQSEAAWGSVNTSLSAEPQILFKAVRVPKQELFKVPRNGS